MKKCAPFILCIFCGLSQLRVNWCNSCRAVSRSIPQAIEFAAFGDWDGGGPDGLSLLGCGVGRWSPACRAQGGGFFQLIDRASDRPGDDEVVASALDADGDASG